MRTSIELDPSSTTLTHGSKSGSEEKSLLSKIYFFISDRIFSSCSTVVE